MTNIPIYFKDGKIAYANAGSERDLYANVVVMLPSLRELKPMKASNSFLPIESDVVAVKYYRSNRGVIYISVYDLKSKTLTYHSNTLNIDELMEILSKYNISDETLREALRLLGIDW